MRPLVRANALLFALLLVHVLDHARQDRGLPAEVSVVGLLGQVLVVVSLLLAMRSSTLAPDAAMAVGFGTAIGFVAVHASPHWWALSDPYAAAGVDALSWIQLTLCVSAATWLGVVGLRARALPSPAAAR